MIGEYQKGFLIGKGVDAKCYLATKNNHTYCIKMIPIQMKEDSKRKNTQKEIEALTRLQNHENIITMVESLITQEDSGDSIHYIITEAMKMNLEQFLRMKKGAISENTCKKISFQVMNALNFCHLNLITHQDIKLENITIDPNTLRVKLIDFGYCSISQSEKEICKLHETQGTPLYLSPEKFLFKKYDGRKSDAWSCGVLIYKLVTGYFPFGEDCKTLKELYSSILSNEYKSPSDCTPHFIDIVDCLLHKNPKERISVNTALQHSWFSQSSNSKVKRNSLVDKLFRGSRNRSKHNSITNC